MSDLTNNFGAYMQLPTFRFWCQHVIPLVYDDSLSYYEVLCKAVKYINSIIADLKVTQDNLTELAENSEGKFEELETLINSSLTGEYGGMRRKILALTDSARESMRDERIQHLRVDSVHYQNGEVSYITFRIQSRKVNVRLRESTPETFGMINDIINYDIKLVPLYGTYSAMADSYLDYSIYINGKEATLDDLYDGRLLNNLTIYKRQGENCYIVTVLTSVDAHIYLKYDSANIPGGNATFTRNPYISTINPDFEFNNLILDNELQFGVGNNGFAFVLTQDSDFVAGQWHKITLQW